MDASRLILYKKKKNIATIECFLHLEERVFIDYLAAEVEDTCSRSWHQLDGANAGHQKAILMWDHRECARSHEELPAAGKSHAAESHSLPFLAKRRYRLPFFGKNK